MNYIKLFIIILKKNIRKNYKEYPKLTKDEYLQILEQTYKLKLESCNNIFKIESMIGSKSSSSGSSSRSSSGSLSKSPPKPSSESLPKSPPKAKKSPKQTKIDNFFKVKAK